MDRDRLTEVWNREELQPFVGWDFSYLGQRMSEGEPPWSYLSRAAALMQRSSSVVDMGTGGGERLLELKEHWPERVVATEEYPPNVRLATERLAPLGVAVEVVKLTTRDAMPFADGEFDLVVNRHSAFNSGEVARILASSGTFFTQQVHGLWAQDLLAAFDAEPQWPESTLATNTSRLETAGLEIVDAQEWSGKLAFSDVGAIVYFLKATPWLVPGFTVEPHIEHLLRLQSRVLEGENLVFEARKYLIKARKRPQRD